MTTPHGVLSAVDAEAALLGACANNPQAATYALSYLRTEDFVDEVYQIIFDAMRTCVDENRDLDAVLLNNYIKGTKAQGILGDLIETCPNLEAYESYTRLIKRASAKRKVVDGMEEVRASLVDGTPLVEVGEKLHQLSKAVALNGIGKTDYVRTTLASMDLSKQHGVDISWGYKSLDSLTGGLRRKQVNIIGGHTSHGKTSFTLNIISHALREGKRVLYNAFENPDQIYPRLASIEHGLPLSYFMKPYLLEPDQYNRAVETMHKMEKYEDNLMILSCANLMEMWERSLEFKPDIVVLDYIQRYAHRFGLGKRGNLTHDIARSLSTFNDLVIESNATGLCLSQFSRPDKRKSEIPIPSLYDLKECGDLENMCDTALLLFWEHKTKLDDMTCNDRQYLVRVAKNKIGETQDIHMSIHKETLRIVDVQGV